jgi:hypothetical protein
MLDFLSVIQCFGMWQHVPWGAGGTNLSLRVAIAAALMTAIGVFPEIQSLFELSYQSRGYLLGSPLHL